MVGSLNNTYLSYRVIYSSTAPLIFSKDSPISERTSFVSSALSAIMLKNDTGFSES